MHLPRKLLIQMSGVPGSGKSTIANLLAQSIDGVVINHDLIRSFFLENDNSFDQSAKLAYCFQWILAEDMIKQGRTVIIDSTCNYKETLDHGTALARQYSYDYRYVECRVDDVDLLEGRLCNRVSLRSQRKGVNSPPPDATDARHSEDYRVHFKRWIEKPYRPASDAIVVDSTSSPEKCLDHILKQIVSPPDKQTSNRAALKKDSPDA
jgi:predicted kinase